MGYRPNLVMERVIEYGVTLGGYNYGYDKLSEFFEKLEVEFFDSENKDYHEVSTNDLLALKDKIESLGLDELEEDNLRSLIFIAEHSEYAKDGYVRIEWF